MQNNKLLVVLTGIAVGAIAVALVALGNPGNMGFCIACFLRDTAGAVGLHRAEVVQYVRPEIIGLVLGAFIMAFAGKEFSPRGGSAPVTRFTLGFCVMVGALMFLGCPLRMMLRIGGGDLNALVGLAGFVAGIGGGIFCLNRGFTLKRTYSVSKLDGYLYPAANVAMLALLCAAPALLFFSESGPGSMHAPIAAALIAGLAVGVLAQKSRFCTVAGIRDTILFKYTHMLIGFIAVIAAVIIGNLIMGSFHIGFEGQPVAHTDGLWNFLGMLLVGLGSVLLGGCPLRQLILSGEGNVDSVVTVLGFVVGAAFFHNFQLASSGDGPTSGGQIAVIIGLAITAAIAFANIQRETKAKA